MVTCELKSGEAYRGTLIEAEDNWNVQIGTASCTHRVSGRAGEAVWASGAGRARRVRVRHPFAWVATRPPRPNRAAPRAQCARAPLAGVRFRQPVLASRAAPADALLRPPHHARRCRCRAAPRRTVASHSWSTCSSAAAKSGAPRAPRVGRADGRCPLGLAAVEQGRPARAQAGPCARARPTLNRRPKLRVGRAGMRALVLTPRCRPRAADGWSSPTC